MVHDEEKQQLHRAMGFVDVLLFFVVTGFNLMWVARAAAAGPVGITVWLLACVTFYVPSALCVLELSSRYPGEGGLYLWSRRAFGDFAGFITGWTYWASIWPFVPSVLYFIASTLAFDQESQHLRESPAYLIAVAFVGLFIATALNVVGLGVGKRLHNLGALATWLPALALIAMGAVAFAGSGSATELRGAAFVPHGSLKELILWPILIMGLTGLEAVSVFGDEMKEARRIIPPALAVSTILVVVTTALGTLAMLIVLLPTELTGVATFMQAFAKASYRVGVQQLAIIVAGFIAIGYLGKVGAWIATGARLPFAAGVDRFLPAAFARVHPRWRTPHVALLFQAAIIAALVLVGQAGTTTKGAYDVFLSMTVIPSFIPILFMFAALIKLQREPLSSGMIRVPGGRPVAIAAGVIGFLTTTSAMVLAVIPPEDEANPALYVTKVVGLGIALVGIGSVLYLAAKRRARSEQP